MPEKSENFLKFLRETQKIAVQAPPTGVFFKIFYGRGVLV